MSTNTTDQNRRVDEDPLNRAHQKSINFLKQEIEAIKAVLTQQLTVVTDFGTALEQRKEHAASAAWLLGTATYAVEPNVVYNCIAALEAKIRSFEDMRLAAANLQATVSFSSSPCVTSGKKQGLMDENRTSR